MKNELLLLLGLSLLIITQGVHAQEEEDNKFPVDISGSVDTYFKTNLTSKNASDGDGGFITPG